MNLKIALLRLLPGKDPDEQLMIGIEACRKAKETGADIALFPEMWNTGYVIPQDERELKTKAISDNDTFIDSFRRIARKLKMAVGITYFL